VTWGIFLWQTQETTFTICLISGPTFLSLWSQKKNLLLSALFAVLKDAQGACGGITIAGIAKGLYVTHLAALVILNGVRTGTSTQKAQK
jgi:hypothetical protein